MSNEILGQLDFEEKIKGWSPPEQFIARQVYGITHMCQDFNTDIKGLDERVGVLEGKGQGSVKKTVTDAIPSGIVAAIVSVIVGVINTFRSG